ncbi:MAG: helix-turn-helix domain-containing protein [Parvibaculum sp.]|nr:helix-turn-helix domain-containing protein [Parvibaculum sp.]
MGVIDSGGAAKSASGKMQGEKPGIILDAALELFRQYGYRRTSMEDIAGAANVAKGTLYIYFKSKDELFEALARRLAEQVGLNVREVLARDLPFEDKVLAVLDAKIGFAFRLVLSSPHAAELTAPTSQLPDDVFGPVDQELRASLAGLFRDAVKRGDVDLKAAGLTPEGAVDTLLAAAHGAEFGAKSEDDFHDRLTRIGRLTLRGLRADL